MRYLVIGAAGYAQEVAWSLLVQTRARRSRCEFLFFDDGAPPGELTSGLGRVVGPLDAVAEYASRRGTRLVLGVGLPRTKASVVARLADLSIPWTTVVHPAAVIGPNVEIGEGTYIGAGAILTVNVRIGRFVTVNLHCQVAHDDVLGDFVTLHPDAHLSGGVSVEEGCQIGTGAIVIPGVTVGAWAVVGAGAVAVRSLVGGRTYVGTPAIERIRRNGLGARVTVTRRTPAPFGGRAVCSRKIVKA